MGEGAAVVVVGGGGGAVVAGRPVPGGAACGCDDGGRVRGGVLGVVLQVVVVMVMGGLSVVGAGADGGQSAVLGDDIRTHAALCPRHSFRGLSILPEGQGQSGQKDRLKYM